MAKENISDLFNPCILVKLDGKSKHGSYVVGLSNYKNMESYAVYQKQLTRIERGLFKDNSGIIHKVIFNEHKK